MSSSSPAPRGALIVLEGLDRSGKSTQCALLVERLNQQRAASSALYRFPDRTTPIGVMIDGYLRNQAHHSDEAIHLMFAANRWERNEEIRKALKEGKTLIVDRYSYSGIAFSSAKGLSMSWCARPESGLPKPDGVFFLALPDGVAETRGEFGAERYEKKEFQKLVKAKFDVLMANDGHWERVDANKGIEEIQAELMGKIKDIQERVKDKPIEDMNMENVV